jgi:predicted transcriptional regulator of viral defense system
MMKNKSKTTSKPSKGLALIDQAVAQGKEFINPQWVMRTGGMSKQAANDLLARLVRSGLLEHVSRGKYVIRPPGVLGVPVAAEDVGVAVAALFEGSPHRLAYRSAFDHFGLVTRPVRTVQVASTARIRQATISDRPLQVVLESEKTVLIGAVPLNHGSHVSGIERALLDGASRPKLVGGVDGLVEAIVLAPTIKPNRLLALSRQLGAHASLRRLGSVLDQMGRTQLAAALYRPGTRRTIRLQPEGGTEAQFLDDKWRVVWNVDRGAVLDAANQ